MKDDFDKINKKRIDKMTPGYFRSIKSYNATTELLNRKGSWRNLPCPCGSEKKYKNCCWEV